MKKFFLFLSFILLFSSRSPTLAQEFSLEISPPLVEITAQPGTTLTQTYQIKNSSAKDILLTTFLKPFQASSEPGLPDYNLSPDPQTPSPTFSLVNTGLDLEKPFTLPAHSSQQIVLKIKTPSHAPTQDYYYTLFFAQVTNPQNQAAALGQIGTNLLITVSSDLNPSVQMKTVSFTVHPKIADLFLSKVSFQGTIENQSNTLFKPYGKIIVNRTWPPENQDQNEFELVLRPDNILKNSSRPIFCLYPDNQSLSTCQLNSYLPPGKYTATLFYCPTLESANSQNCQEISLNFYVLPYLILLLLLPLFYYLFKKRSKT
jgi:hypothetical protein